MGLKQKDIILKPERKNNGAQVQKEGRKDHGSGRSEESDEYTSHLKLKRT